VSHFYENQLAAVGAGCVGGDPSRWADIQIGERIGKVELQCGSAEALVQAGDRVYLFELGGPEYISDQTYSLNWWKALLRGVTFDPTKAKN
jgi:hypothetical protein